MHVLSIEDDVPTAHLLAAQLSLLDMQSSHAHSGQEGIEQARVKTYDLILLDLGLPDMSGIDVLCALRSHRIDTPIIILSGETNVETKVSTFANGADDYLTKPFHKDELAARIHAVVRRSRKMPPPTITIGNFVVNLAERTVKVHGVKVPLTSLEYRFFEFLALRKGIPTSKEVFMRHLYGSMDVPQAKIVDVFISKLRKKLRTANNNDHYIETLWGEGYVLQDTKVHESTTA